MYNTRQLDSWRALVMYLLCRFPVRGPHVCKESLSTVFLVLRLQLVGFFEHVDHVRVLSIQTRQ
jgi:hypothetical protein